MFQNKWSGLVYILVGLSLAMVAVLTVHAGLATAALSDHSYDSIEQVRVDRSAALADHSYDAVEQVRSNRSAAPSVDHSYDQVERIRADRTALTPDHSYAILEALRLDRLTYLVGQGLANLSVKAQSLLPAPSPADHSYDAIERLRLDRGSR